MNLLIVTFADKPLSEENFLRKSCEEWGVPLKVLISSPWIQNVIKLKMLYEFIQDQDPELVLLIVDAYDVVIYGDQQQILSEFRKQRADILFSAESNFMYKEPAKWFEFLRKYPRQSTIYKYLNSGSYMGRVKHIIHLLETLQVWFSINLLNEELLMPIKSDQYLLSRFYAENYYLKTGLELSLDAKQELLGCTGGRFCVLKFPDLTKWQSFSFFIIERNLLKFFSLHKHQKRPKDFVYQKGQFYNKKMQTYPTVMHFPGTWDRFDKVLAELSDEHQRISKSKSWILAATVSLFSFVSSLVAAPIFWLLTRRLGN